MAANAVIGALRVTLGLDSAEFERGLRKTQDTLGSLNLGKGLLGNLKAIEGGLHETAAGAGVAGEALARFGGIGIAAAAALGGFVEVMRRTHEAIDIAAEFGKLAKTVGVTTDFIQEFNFAAHQSDVDVGVANQALKALNETVGVVEKNLPRAKVAIAAFKELGFSPADLKRFNDVGELFPVLAERIANAGNAAQQAALAKRIGIAELLPLLKDGADGFSALAQKARDLGIVMDADLVRKSEEAKKKLAEIADVTKAKANVTFAEFADTLIAVKNAFAGAERAGLSFLAALTNTVPAEERLNHLRQQRASLDEDARKTGAFNKDRASVLDAQINAIELAQINSKLKSADEAARFNPPASAGIPAKQKGDIAGASDQAIATARRAELEAEQALTKNIAQLAVLRQHAVDVETADANKHLRDEANAGKISKAAAETAIALNTKAAGEKKALIVQEATFAAQNQSLEHAEAIAGYEQQIAQVEASLAKSAETRGQIEAKALTDRQETERKRLATETEQKRLTGALTEREQAELQIEQLAAQAAERKRQAADTNAAIQEEINARAESTLELQIDLLRSQADAADTDGERLKINLQLLKTEQALEKLKLEEVRDNENLPTLARERAKAELAILDQLNSNETRALVGGLFDSFNRAESAVGGLAQAFKSHNWSQVAQGLVSTIQSLQVAFGPNGTIGSKIGAAAGVGSAVGGAIGGVAGSTISGIAGGASLGFSFGGPIGAVVGGILGGIAGFFSGSSAKKAQQAADAKAAAEAAAAHATAVATEAMQLQIQILNAEGKSEEALALQRQAAISAVNAENQALEIQLLDLQAAADKAARAAAVAAQGHDLQLQILDLTGDAIGALNARRADELAALDDSNKGLQQEIFNLTDLASARDAAAKAEQDAAQVVSDARAQLSAARDAEAQALTETISRFQQYAESLNSYRESLAPAASSPATANLAGLASQFRTTAALAALGNEDALGSLQGLSEQYRAAAQAQAHTAAEAKAVDDKIRAGVTAAADTASRQVSVAQQQLASLKSMVDAELGTTNAVLSVVDAIKALQQAETAQAAAGPAAFAAAIASLAGAEGSNISVLPTLPPAPVAPVVTDTTSPVVDAAVIAAAVSGDAAGQMALQNAILAQIAKNTGTSADLNDLWNTVGIPTVAA